jgi:PhzF family phenazine biosynthesis protein
MSAPLIERWTAFSDEPTGGNPAGVVLDASGLSDAELQRIAAEVGYAETAFLTPGAGGASGPAIRYFSPIAEVPFCGHATVATALAIASKQGDGTITFVTPVGPVEITTATDARGRVATFTSIDPRVEPLAPTELDAALSVIGLTRDDLDPAVAPGIAFAGNRHPVLVIADRARFDAFEIEAAAARELMDAAGWTGTITVLHRDGADEARWHARNVFPVGTMTEDPATGSAAAAVGGYLRELEIVSAPARITIEQGRHVGRPSELVVDIPVAGGIAVSGRGARIR